MSLSISSSGLTPPDPAKMREQMFKRVDTDGNGTISKDELKAMLEKHAKRASETGNTQQSPDADQLFSTADADGDGSLSQTEFDSAMKTLRPAGEHHHHKKAEGSENSQMLDSILQTLSSSDGKGAEALTDEQKKFIQNLVDELKKTGLYNAQGSDTASGSPSAIFGTTA